MDVQRWFTEPEHPFAQVVEKLVPGATDGYFDRVTSTVLPNIQRLQQAFRSLGRPVISTCVTPQINAIGLVCAQEALGHLQRPPRPGSHGNLGLQ